MDKPSISNRHVSNLDLNHEGFLDLLEAVPAKGKPFRFRVAGISMHPYIKDGDVVTIEKTQGKILRIGDVVAAIHPQNGRLMIHRIIKKTSDGYLVNGDNIPNSDVIVQSDKILGIVSSISRDGVPVLFGLGHEKILIAALSPIDKFPEPIQPIVRFMIKILKRMAK